MRTEIIQTDLISKTPEPGNLEIGIIVEISLKWGELDDGRLGPEGPPRLFFSQHRRRGAQWRFFGAPSIGDQGSALARFEAPDQLHSLNLRTASEHPVTHPDWVRTQEPSGQEPL
jgi:hypothetical protein